MDSAPYEYFGGSASAVHTCASTGRGSDARFDLEVRRRPRRVAAVLRRDGRRDPAREHAPAAVPASVRRPAAGGHLPVRARCSRRSPRARASGTPCAPRPSRAGAGRGLPGTRGVRRWRLLWRTFPRRVRRNGYSTCDHSVTYYPGMDDVFRALADPTRRSLLDELFKEDGQTLSALEERAADDAVRRDEAPEGARGGGARRRPSGAAARSCTS